MLRQLIFSCNSHCKYSITSFHTMCRSLFWVFFFFFNQSLRLFNCGSVSPTISSQQYCWEKMRLGCRPPYIRKKILFPGCFSLASFSCNSCIFISEKKHLACNHLISHRLWIHTTFYVVYIVLLGCWETRTIPNMKTLKQNSFRHTRQVALMEKFDIFDISIKYLCQVGDLFQKSAVLWLHIGNCKKIIQQYLQTLFYFAHI